MTTATGTRSRAYTGVGSRETPPGVLAVMCDIGECLARAGFTLRSGGAPGADLAFEQGARRCAQAALEIYLPWRGFNGNPSDLYTVGDAAMTLAATVHPVWANLEAAIKKLHARNCYQVLGSSLNAPSDFLIAWTADGCESEATRSRGTGGTGTAIVLAARRGIPVFNLGRQGTPARLADHLKALAISLPEELARGDQPSLF